MQTHRHQADILIIGGGVCGLNAALTAREQGRSVIVMDKAVIERSGHIAGGIDHFPVSYTHLDVYKRQSP